LTGLFLCLFTAQAQDKTLDYYLEQGLVNSPYLKDLQNQIQSNTIDSLLIHAAQKPVLSFTGNFYYAPVINSWGYSEVITNGQNFITTLNVSQPLFNRKTVETQYAQIGIRTRSLTNLTHLTGNELKKTITDQYLTAYSIHNDIQFYSSALAFLQEQDTLLRQQVEGGFFRQTDYLSFVVEMQSLELTLTDARGQYRKELSALNLLCGIRDATEYQLVPPELTEKAVPSSENSPLFLRFTLDSLAIENEKDLIARRYKPTVSWQSDAGIINNKPREIYKNFGLSIGLNFALPVYDGQQRKLNFQKLSFTEDTRKNYEIYFRRQVSEQLGQLEEELATIRQTIPKIRNQLQLAETIIRQNKSLLNSGSITINDYIISLKNFLEIRNNLKQYEVKTLRLINEINYWKQ